jgi:hypothetical protein
MLTEKIQEADIVFLPGIYDKKIAYMTAKNEAGYEYLYINGFNPLSVGNKREVSKALARHIANYSLADGMVVYVSSGVLS